MEKYQLCVFLREKGSDKLKFIEWSNNLDELIGKLERLLKSLKSEEKRK